MTSAIPDTIADMRNTIGIRTLPHQGFAFTEPKMKPTYPWRRNAEGMPITVISWMAFRSKASDAALAFDRKAIQLITVIGIPSAFLLHGYVGFIFGSVKANPWWGSVLMPIVFLMSAIVSGIALVMFLYM